MSLRDVKVGDEVVVKKSGEWRRGPGSRYPVTAIGRKYFTAGNQQFSIETGQAKGPVYGSAVYAYTEARLARIDMESGLRKAAAAAENASRMPLAHLSDDELRDLTATLNAAAEKMEKK